MEEINIKQINKEVKQLEKNFSKVVAINQQANEEIQQLKTQVEYLIRVNKEVVFLMRDSMFSSTNKEDYRKAMDTKQLAEYTNMDEQTVIRICKELKSPAYKTGNGKTSKWRCSLEKFEQYLIKRTIENKYKG